MRKKPTGRKVAEQNADKLLALMYPGAPVAKAGKQITWLFRDGQRFPMSRAEDVFGCFDRLVATPDRLVAIQATILGHDGGGAVAARKRKVRELFCDPLIATLGAGGAAQPGVRAGIAAWITVEVWAWEPRRAMHVWTWSWTEREWHRSPSVYRVKRGESRRRPAPRGARLRCEAEGAAEAPPRDALGGVHEEGAVQGRDVPRRCTRS